MSGCDPGTPEDGHRLPILRLKFIRDWLGLVDALKFLLLMPRKKLLLLPAVTLFGKNQKLSGFFSRVVTNFHIFERVTVIGRLFRLRASLTPTIR